MYVRLLECIKDSFHVWIKKKRIQIFGFLGKTWIFEYKMKMKPIPTSATAACCQPVFSVRVPPAHRTGQASRVHLVAREGLEYTKASHTNTKYRNLRFLRFFVGASDGKLKISGVNLEFFCRLWLKKSRYPYFSSTFWLGLLSVPLRT